MPVELGSSGTGSSGRIGPSLGDVNLYNGWFANSTQDVTGHAVSPYSDTVISLHGAAQLHLDFVGPGGPGIYGTPYNVVSSSFARQVFTSVFYDGQDSALPFPIDTSLSFQGEAPGADLTITPVGYDRHFICYVRDDITLQITDLFEVYNPILSSDHLSWRCVSCAHWSIPISVPRILGQTSMDGAGLAMAPLMLRYEDVNRGDVGHVIRASFGTSVMSNTFVDPARHAANASGVANRLQWGGVLRMRQAYYDANKASYTGQARVIFDGLRKYGMMNADLSGPQLPPFVTGCTDDRWDWQTGDSGDIFHLQNVPVTAFEMLDFGPVFTITANQSPIIAGTLVTFTVARAVTDSNFAFTVYVKIQGDPHLYTAICVLSSGAPSATFTYTFPAPGVYSTTISAPGASWLIPTCNWSTSGQSFVVVEF